MKKLILILMFFMILFACVSAQTIHYVTEADISWNVVTELNDGTPIPAEDTIEYEIYFKDSQGIEIYIGMTSNTTYHIIVPETDKYAVGVRTVRISSGEEITYSSFTWSDIDGEFTPNPFLYVHPSQQIIPKVPLGLSME